MPKVFKILQILNRLNLAYENPPEKEIISKHESSKKWLYKTCNFSTSKMHTRLNQIYLGLLSQLFKEDLCTNQYRSCCYPQLWVVPDLLVTTPWLGRPVNPIPVKDCKLDFQNVLETEMVLQLLWLQVHSNASPSWSRDHLLFSGLRSNVSSKRWTKVTNQRFSIHSANSKWSPKPRTDGWFAHF